MMKTNLTSMTQIAVWQGRASQQLLHNEENTQNIMKVEAPAMSQFQLIVEKEGTTDQEWRSVKSGM